MYICVPHALCPEVFISPETGVADGYESSSEHWISNLEGQPLL